MASSTPQQQSPTSQQQHQYNFPNICIYKKLTTELTSSLSFDDHNNNTKSICKIRHWKSMIVIKDGVIIHGIIKLRKKEEKEKIDIGKITFEGNMIQTLILNRDYLIETEQYESDMLKKAEDAMRENKYWFSQVNARYVDDPQSPVIKIEENVPSREFFEEHDYHKVPFIPNRMCKCLWWE